MAPSPAEAALPAPPLHPLRNRILSAVVLAPLALAVVALGGPLFALWIAVAAALMAREWARMTAAGRGGAAGLVLAVGAVAGVGATVAGVPPWQSGIGLLAGAALVYGLARSDGVEAAGWLAAGLVAIGLPCTAFVWLREQPIGGRSMVFWLLAVVWATDIGAYAVGRWLGGPRLAPRISPNKTWAGLLGGMASAALVSGCVAAVLDGGAGLAGAALVGGGLAVVAQAGDLGESLVKRRFGVKDTGALIPGHGGLLDRVDGLLATTPVVALLVWLEGGSVVGWS
jgi:phosphatidate cytidylyltransferase